LNCKNNILPTAMPHGGSPTIKQPDPMVKIKTSQPTQGKFAESPQGAMTDTPAPTLQLADAQAKMEAAQLALEALDARYSGRAGVMPWCEHFDGIDVEWQWMKISRKTVEPSLIYKVVRTSDQDKTKGKAQRSMAVKPLHTPMVDLPAQGMPKGNLPTTPAAPTLTLAGTQAAADNPLEAALGQATREEAKLPPPSLAIEPVCTRPNAAMNAVKSDIPTANTPVRPDASNGKMMPLRAAVPGTKVLVQIAGMTQVVSVSDISTPACRILKDTCSSDEHAPRVKFLQILQDLEMTRLSLHLALQVAEGAWGKTTSGGLSLKRKLYPLARKGSMAEIAKARLLGAELDTHISITLDAIDLDTSSHDIFHTRNDQLLGATRILLASGRLSEHFYQIPSFNRMYPFCFTLDERQSIGQKRTGLRASEEEGGDGGDGQEEEEPAEQGKGNWIRNSTLPFKGSTVAKPRPLRTGRKPKKRRTQNGCRIYGGAPSSTPPKTPRPNLMWFGSMSQGPRDPP